MKGTLLLIILLANSGSTCFSQIVDGPPGYLDSLKYQSVMAKVDTSRVLALTDLSWTYAFIDFDSAAMLKDNSKGILQKILNKIL